MRGSGRPKVTIGQRYAMRDVMRAHVGGPPGLGLRHPSVLKPVKWHSCRSAFAPRERRFLVLPGVCQKRHEFIRWAAHWDDGAV